MAFVIFTTLTDAQSYQNNVDIALGFPEDIATLTWLGIGIHAPKELGLAIHYQPIIKHLTLDQWALPRQDVDTELCPGYEPPSENPTIVPVPGTASAVDTLPEGWLPVGKFG